MNDRGGIVLAALCLLGGIAFSRPAPAAAWRAQCLSIESRILRSDVGYCALIPPSYDSPKQRRFPVLYFLHGLGDNQQMFIRPGGLDLIEDLWERHRIGQFLIVTPQAGASFYINSRDGRVRYEDFFIREFMPYIQRHYRLAPGRRNRGIAGISMGGYGALHLAFRHPELFSSASVESAALFKKLPEIRIAGSPSGPAQVAARILGGAFGTPPDPAFWDRNSPLALARTFHPLGLKIYFNCGTEDDFGFDAGARQLDKILTSRRIPDDFHLYPGGHNWLYFAQHLPETLQFSSQSFAPGEK